MVIIFIQLHMHHEQVKTELSSRFQQKPIFDLTMIYEARQVLPVNMILIICVIH